MPQNSTVLIVDDTQVGQEILGDLLNPEGYRLAYASSGRQALEKCALIRPDLILLDVMMPEMDGYAVCRQIRANPALAEIPVVMITALDDQNSCLQGLDSGADDFITKPFNRPELRARIRTILRLNRYRRLLEERSRFSQLFNLSPDGILLMDADHCIISANQAMAALLQFEHEEELSGRCMLDFVQASHLEAMKRYCRQTLDSDGPGRTHEVVFVGQAGRSIPVEISAAALQWNHSAAIQLIVRDTTEREQAEERLHQANHSLRSAYEATIEGWARALELRDLETELHSERVSELTLRLADLLGVSEAEKVHLRRGVLLHDVGKMAIPDSILFKPGPLDEQEWEIMRRHPLNAYKLLAPIEYLRPALEIPLYHHEKWDGSGYPYGLKGEAIPLAARIFAVIDVWDALRFDRPYRKAWPEEQVTAYICEQSGLHFDPQVVTHFLRLIQPG